MLLLRCIHQLPSLQRTQHPQCIPQRLLRAPSLLPQSPAELTGYSVRYSALFSPETQWSLSRPERHVSQYARLSRSPQFPCRRVPTSSSATLPPGGKARLSKLELNGIHFDPKMRLSICHCQSRSLLFLHLAFQTALHI